MLTVFAGPVFFAAALTLIAVGLGFLSILWREGWLIVSLGFLAMGLAVPGWLTVVGTAMFIGGCLTYGFWRARKIGRSF